MKILLFGGSGQLGFEILKRAEDLNFQTISPVASEVDISEGEQVMYLAKQIEPDLIVNAAAYTAVDKAEEEPEAGYAINAEGAANVARAAKAAGCRLIHISTDYVFDGNVRAPIDESAAVNPLNVYGKTKLQGEKEIFSIYPEKSLILRTSSLYGQRGVNFVRTMLELFKTRESVKVVNDQFMSPTWAGWLAEAVLDLGRLSTNGLLHATCSGSVSWYDFAAEILRLSRTVVKPAENFQLLPTTAAEFARPAKRPAYSVLDCSRLSQALGRPPMTWQAGLKCYLQETGMLGAES